jgi:hypothetical protein
MTRNVDYEHWSRVSSKWIEWARAPNHDAFWAYREALLAIVGRGEGEALDVGCGGSRLGRAEGLRLQGHGVRSCPGIGERGKGGAIG